MTKCQLCGSPVKVVGNVTMHYEPVTDTKVDDLIKSNKKHQKDSEDVHMEFNDVREELQEKVDDIISSYSDYDNNGHKPIVDFILSKECLEMLKGRFTLNEKRIVQIVTKAAVHYKASEDMVCIILRDINQADVLRVRK